MSVFFPSQLSGRKILAFIDSAEAEFGKRSANISYLHSLSIESANDAELEGVGLLAGLPWPTESAGTFDDTAFIVGAESAYPVTSLTQGFSGVGLSTGGLLSSAVPKIGIRYPSAWYRFVLPIVAELRYLGPSLANIDRLMHSFSPFTPIPGCVAHWSMDNVPEIPDNVAATAYVQDAWATIDGWGVAGGTGSVSGGNLSLTATSGNLYITKTSMSFSGDTNRTIRFKIRQIAGTVNPTMSIYYITSGHSWSESYYLNLTGRVPSINTWYIIDVDMSALTVGGTDWITNTITGIRLDPGSTSGDQFDIDFIYIGTGLYTTPLADNSGNGNNATIYGPTPVTGISGKALAFDGVNDRLRTAVLASIPDVWHFRFVFPNGFAQSATARQTLINYRPQLGTAGHLWLVRNPSADSLFFGYSNGSISLETGIATNIFTGFSSTRIDIDITIDWVAGTVTTYRNGVLFGSAVSLTTPAKPLSGSNLYIGSYQGSLHFLAGTIDEPRIYNRALSASETLSLYDSPGQASLPPYSMSWNTDHDLEVTFTPALSTARLTILQRLVETFIVSPFIKIIQG